MIYLFSNKNGLTLASLRNGSPSINWLQVWIFSFCIFLLTGTGAMIMFRLLAGFYSIKVFLLIGAYLSIVATSIAVFKELKKVKQMSNESSDP